MVHDERQMPQVPWIVSFEQSNVDMASLTPIRNICIDSISPLVVCNGVHIPIAPPACLDGLIFIVSGLDLKLLEQFRNTTHIVGLGGYNATPDQKQKVNLEINKVFRAGCAEVTPLITGNSSQS